MSTPDTRVIPESVARPERKHQFTVKADYANFLEAGIDQLSLAGLGYSRQRIESAYLKEGEVRLEVTGQRMDPVLELDSDLTRLAKEHKDSGLTPELVKEAVSQVTTRQGLADLNPRMQRVLKPIPLS